MSKCSQISHWRLAYLLRFGVVMRHNQFTIKTNWKQSNLVLPSNAILRYIQPDLTCYSHLEPNEISLLILTHCVNVSFSVMEWLSSEKREMHRSHWAPHSLSLSSTRSRSTDGYPMIDRLWNCARTCLQFSTLFPTLADLKLTVSVLFGVASQKVYSKQSNWYDFITQICVQ